MHLFLYFSWASQYNTSPKLDVFSCESTTHLFNLEINITNSKKKFHYCCCNELHTFRTTFSFEKKKSALTSIEFLTNMAMFVRNSIKVMLTSRRLRLLKTLQYSKKSKCQVRCTELWPKRVVMTKLTTYDPGQETVLLVLLNLFWGIVTVPGFPHERAKGHTPTIENCRCTTSPCPLLLEKLGVD